MIEFIIVVDKAVFDMNQYMIKQ